MRIVLCTIILSLVWGGFSAASHAFTDMNTHATVEAVSGECDNPAQPCDIKADDHKHSKGICLDCHHCCVSHFGMMPSFTLVFQDTGDILEPLPAQTHPGLHPPSLLRPPRILT